MNGTEEKKSGVRLPGDDNEIHNQEDKEQVGDLPQYGEDKNQKMDSHSEWRHSQAANYAESDALTSTNVTKSPSPNYTSYIQ